MGERAIQSRWHSLAEASVNVAFGFALSFAVWEWGVLKLIEGGLLSYQSTLAITTIFTIVSLIRSYLIRRLCHWRDVARVGR